MEIQRIKQGQDTLDCRGKMVTVTLPFTLSDTSVPTLPIYNSWIYLMIALKLIFRVKNFQVP